MEYLLILPVIIILYVLVFYNRLKTIQVRIKASIQEIGNQLKRQASLIPNLVKSVEGYLKHETGIFKELTSARKLTEQASKSNSPQDIEKSQKLISKVLGSLKVIVESNPELKASSLVSDMMNELRDTADKLLYSRRTLIDLSADYNSAIVTIPGVWIASMLGFKPEKGLETPLSGEHIQVSVAETKTPEVKLG